MSVIVYELNEVPKKILDFYANSHPNSAFAYLRHHSELFKSETADVGELSPWITWPTMHRGVSNIEHEITDLGQNLNKVNKEFPNIYNILAKQGVKVGVFGCLQSYPLPNDLDNFRFYVPDTFAAGDECFPDKLNSFQAFNLSMVRRNARNVSKGIAVKDAFRFILKSKQLGLKLKTFMKLTNQIVSERINNDRVVRRRTSQVEIAFDLYMKQIKDTKPDISFFFTNHVASSMHRYWPTIFPQDYGDGKFDKGWLQRWSDEIPYAVKVTNYQLTQLINYCKSKNSELIVCSSMGQAAVVNSINKSKLVQITNLNFFLSYLGIKKTDWEPRLSMSPQVVIKPKNGSVIDNVKKLRNIFFNGKNINFKIINTGEIVFEINLINQENLTIIDGEKKINKKDIGVDNVNLPDAAGSYAYHIPEGVLLHYNPKKILKNSLNQYWKPISVLDFAPSLLNKFSKKIPSYMKNEKLFN
jgi:hypothetical protein